MRKTIFISCLLLSLAALAGCSKGSETSAQSRTDLTADHIRGLSADMDRRDVEDLIGQDDDNLAGKEDIDVYSLSDGTTAVLRYVDDKLAGAYIRGKDMYEDTIFSKFVKDIKENLDEGEYNTEDGKVTGDTDATDDGNVRDTNDGSGITGDTQTNDTGNDAGIDGTGTGAGDDSGITNDTQPATSSTDPATETR